MTSKNVMVLTVAKEALEVMLANLPKNDCTFWFLIDDRAASPVVLKQLLHKHKVAEKCADVKVISGKQVIEWWQEHTVYDGNFAKIWPKTLHVIEYIFALKKLGLEKVLVLEDDIILFDGFEQVFEEDRSLGLSLSFNIGLFITPRSLSEKMYSHYILRETLGENALKTLKKSELKSKLFNGGAYYLNAKTLNIPEIDRCTYTAMNSTIAKICWSQCIDDGGISKVKKASKQWYIDELFAFVILGNAGVENGLQKYYNLLSKNEAKKKKPNLKPINHIMSNPKNEAWESLLSNEKIVDWRMQDE